MGLLVGDVGAPVEELAESLVEPDRIARAAADTTAPATTSFVNRFGLLLYYEWQADCDRQS